MKIPVIPRRAFFDRLQECERLQQVEEGSHEMLENRTGCQSRGGPEDLNGPTPMSGRHVDRSPWRSADKGKRIKGEGEVNVNKGSIVKTKGQGQGQKAT